MLEGRLDALRKRGGYVASGFIGALALLVLMLVAAPVLRGQAAQLWPERRRYSLFTAPDGGWLDSDVVQEPRAWEELPFSIFTTPISRCSITPDGVPPLHRHPALTMVVSCWLKKCSAKKCILVLQLRPQRAAGFLRCPMLPETAPARRVLLAGDVMLRAPATELPFLFNLTTEALPTKQESCGHCQAPVGDNCNITKLPHSCCGVCQFDGRMCGKLYPGEGRSEAAAQRLLQEGYRLHVSEGGNNNAKKWCLLCGGYLAAWWLWLCHDACSAPSDPFLFIACPAGLHALRAVPAHSRPHAVVHGRQPDLVRGNPSCRCLSVAAVCLPGVLSLGSCRISVLKGCCL